MSNCILKLYIECFKNKKTEVFPNILNEFKNLIKYYSSRLNYEDSYCELILFFTELIFSIDTKDFKSDGSNGLSRYIAVCIRNKYIELAKKRQRQKPKYFPFFENCFTAERDIETRLELLDMLQLLSDKQRQVIIYKYYYTYTDIEISKIMGISRQAVNQIKNRALEILRLNFKE